MWQSNLNKRELWLYFLITVLSYEVFLGGNPTEEEFLS